MYYNSNRSNKASNPYNIKNFIENVTQTKEQSTISLQPKTTINSKTDNLNLTENSENTINNINPLSKSKDSKDSNSNLYSSLQYNLFTAVECNDLEKAANIMKNYPNQIDSLNDEGLSPLHIAVIKGNLKMIDLLLKNGANSNIPSEKNKHTPMHLACLNQNSMTEEILQELKNFNANENICDANNKKPFDYLNKGDNIEGETSAEKKQGVSNTNTIMVITNENHFDSFMTSNKEEDNKSNINSTINNNTIQTPTKLEEGNNVENNEYDYNNEPTITINSNNQYNTNNTVNSKTDSVNRRQYTFGREEDFYKFQNKNENNNQINNNTNKNNNNNIKDMNINYNNINNKNGKENIDNNIINNNFLQNIINADKSNNIENIDDIDLISQTEIKIIEDEQKNELSDSLENLSNSNINNKNKGKNKIKYNINNINNINIYQNEFSEKQTKQNNNIDSFSRNNGQISNSILTYTDSMNVNGSTPQSKKISIHGTFSNSLNSNLKDNMDDIELKLPQMSYNNINNNNNSSPEKNKENQKDSLNNIEIINDALNVDQKANLNIDDFYKKIILKKRDSIIKSHRTCNTGIIKYHSKNSENNELNNINIENTSFNSQNSFKNSENNNKTVIHNTSKDKDNNSSIKNITVIHNNNYNNYNLNGNYDSSMNKNKFSKNNVDNYTDIPSLTTKTQTNKIKANGINGINSSNTNYKENITNKNSRIDNSLLPNNSEINNISTNNKNNITEFKYLDNYANNNDKSSNYINSNDNSRINFNINEIINDCSMNNSKNILSSLKYWLNSIDLINYYPNFVNNGIHDISYLIEKMKSYQTKLKYENIENNLKIRKPGHIYRILCRLEVDANLIDNKVTKFLLKNNKIFNKNGFGFSGGFENNDKNMHLLISQDYQCFGCCKTNKKFSNLVKNDLKSFLKRYGLLNFYQNFYHNGFELIEYVILQMYGGYPINDEILENCFHVYEEEQRKKILKAIVSEMKKINEFLISDDYNNNENMEYAKYENIIFCNDQNGEEAKIMINNGKNGNCLIF
jgi:hypothetical protein